MKAIDLAKALGVAALILVLDLACAFALVSIWAAWIEPGHPRDFYVAAAPGISTISTRIAGPLLFALFVWLSSRKKKLERNPLHFAVAVFLSYAFLDGATVAFHGFFNQVVYISLVLKLAGAIVGAVLAGPRVQMG